MIMDMRLLFGLFVSALLVLGITGCKRVAYCENKCYKCMSGSSYHSSIDVCVSDLESEQELESNIIAGYDCRKIEPSIFYKLQGNREDVKQQMSANESKYINCYDEEDYIPDYFDYNAYVQRMDKCLSCNDSIALTFIMPFVDSVIGRFGYPTEFTAQQRDTISMIEQYFSDKAMQIQCGGTNVTKVSAPGYTFNAFMYYVAFVMPDGDERDNYIAALSWMDFNPDLNNYFLDPPIVNKCP